MEPGDEAFIVDRGPSGRRGPEADLAAVGVAAQHKVPTVVTDEVLAVGVVAEDDAGAGPEALCVLEYESNRNSSLYVA